MACGNPIPAGYDFAARSVTRFQSSSFRCSAGSVVASAPHQRKTILFREGPLRLSDRRPLLIGRPYWFDDAELHEVLDAAESPHALVAGVSGCSLLSGDFDNLERGDDVYDNEDVGDTGPIATKVRVKAKSLGAD